MAANRPEISVPYLSKEALQEQASLLLAEYGEKSAPVTTPPVPVEEILECHLQLTLEIADLQALLGHRDILGALWFDDKLVRVDASLDPQKDPKMLGRFRFTLAHEAGHWRLHRTHFLKNPESASSQPHPAYVCRRRDGKKPIEWQADYFAAHLLMPTEMVYRAWEQWRRSTAPVYLEDLWDLIGEEAVREEMSLRHDAAQANPRMAQDTVMNLFIRPLAEIFEASSEALRIRCEELGLLLRQRDGGGH